MATDDGYSFMAKKGDVFEVSDASFYEQDGYRLAKPYEKPKKATTKAPAKKATKKNTKKTGK